MSTSNIWSVQTYPLSDFKTQFNSLSELSQTKVIKLLRDLVIMTDPEDHNFSIDCPSIQGFNHAVKYILDEHLVLIVALDRIDSGVKIERIITLHSCSE